MTITWRGGPNLLSLLITVTIIIVRIKNVLGSSAKPQDGPPEGPPGEPPEGPPGEPPEEPSGSSAWTTTIPTGVLVEEEVDLLSGPDLNMTFLANQPDGDPAFGNEQQDSGGNDELDTKIKSEEDEDDEIIGNNTTEEDEVDDLNMTNNETNDFNDSGDLDGGMHHLMKLFGHIFTRSATAE